MRLPSNQARAFVFGPPELAERLVSQFNRLGIQAEWAATPLSSTELASWLSAHATDASTFVHPGLSVWADRPEFPQMTANAGFFPITPDSRTLSLCLNKLNVACEAEAWGIPHLAMNLDPLSSLREIDSFLGQDPGVYPIVLKSLQTAQGHGIHVVNSREELHASVPVWFEQLKRRYDDASVLIERCLPSARHLVIPFAADPGRFIEVFPAVDATLQSRWRRVLQSMPAEGLDAGVEERLNAYVSTWVEKSGFSGMGTLEFLLEGERLFLSDASARLSTSFPLWEELCGFSSVEWQLAALGQWPVPERKPSPPSRAGLVLHLYAEDPLRQIPAPGKIREMSESSEFQWEKGRASWMGRYREGDEVRWDSSGVLGELFCFAETRKSALVCARKTLDALWIAGSLRTNQAFLGELVEHPFVRENLVHAGFMDEDFLPSGAPLWSEREALVRLAWELFSRERKVEAAEERWALGGVPLDPEELSRLRKPEWRERSRFEAHGQEGISGDLLLGKEWKSFLFEPLGKGSWLAHCGAWAQPLRRWLKTGGLRPPQEKRRRILALAAGRVHALLRIPGETLSPGDWVCTLESTRVLVPHAVPLEVQLLEWKVKPGDIVEAGHELAVLELLG